MVQVTMAQNTPQNFVNAHNTAWAQVGVGAMKWNTTIAKYAQTYANRMASAYNLVHSNGLYGENLVWGYGCEFMGC